MNTTRCRGCAIRSSAMRGHDIANYIVQAASCGRPSIRDVQPVLLIDEIDKADIEFPNDLLRELDRMEFYVYETASS
jgi:MoxR-like ATPase